MNSFNTSILSPSICILLYKHLFRARFAICLLAGTFFSRISGNDHLTVLVEDRTSYIQSGFSNHTSQRYVERERLSFYDPVVIHGVIQTDQIVVRLRKIWNLRSIEILTVIDRLPTNRFTIGKPAIFHSNECSSFFCLRITLSVRAVSSYSTIGFICLYLKTRDSLPP